jgi:hypothetical protein
VKFLSPFDRARSGGEFTEQAVRNATLETRSVFSVGRFEEIASASFNEMRRRLLTANREADSIGFLTTEGCRVSPTP